MFTETESADENSNNIEQTNKLFELETKMAESVTEKVKTEERIERLQTINSSMQQMFVTNMEKAKIESDSQMSQLKIQVAQLNTELAKEKTGLGGQTETQATTEGLEDFDDAVEIAKVTEQKFELKVKELLKVQTQLEVIQKQMVEKGNDI